MKLKHISYLILLISASVILYSCGSQKPSVTAAEKAFNNEKYFTAADLYKQAIPNVRKKEAKAELTYKVGECYRLINNNKQAAIWYEKAIKAGYDSSFVYLRWAESLKSMDRFDDAIEIYQDYLAGKPQDSIAKKSLENCKLAVEWRKKEVFFDVFNEVSINTKDMEYAPAIYGKGIIFTSNRGKVKGKDFYERTGKSYDNIYASQTTGKNKWTKPSPLNKDINTAYNEGVATFDNENRILYFTQCNGPKGKENSCKIFETQNEGNTWTAPKEVMIPNPDSNIVGHPSINKEGTRLYFVSDMKGGFGGKDIWYTDKEGSSWGTPVNAGPKINTAGDEGFPFIHPSGTLYFSSNGHPGIGGYDIFFADWEDNDWTEVMNLKNPTNSTADDFGFVLDENKEVGYLSSNRFGGKGEDDIYSAYAIPLVFTISGKTINNSTSKVLPQTKITIIGSDGTTQTAVSDATGSYKFTIKKDVNYQLNASKYRFFGDVGEASTYGLKESKDYTVNFKLNPIPLKEIVLKGILYDLASAELREESISQLDSLIKTLNDNPSFVIEIASHTDSRADSAYNYDLSQRRAQSVVNYLVSKGIEVGRLVPKGYGESRLLNDCKDGVECSEELHQQNRRTSFSVVSEDYVSKEAPKLPDAGKPKPAAPAPAKPGTGAIKPATTPNNTVRPASNIPASATPSGTAKPTSNIPASATPSGTAKPASNIPASATPSGTAKPASNIPASATPSGTAKPTSNIPASATPSGTAKPASKIPASATPSGTAKPASNIPASATPSGTAKPASTSTTGTPAGTIRSNTNLPASATPSGTAKPAGTVVAKPVNNTANPASTVPASATPSTTPTNQTAKPRKP